MLMVAVNYEIWVWSVQDDGSDLHMLCMAGPDGDEERARNEHRARLLHVFAAESRFLALSYYHRYLGREPYVAYPHYREDFTLFTEEQAARQRAGEPIGSPFGQGAYACPLQ